MSMTYYAVTDDPNELAHFGILGMKWGRRRTPEQLGHPRHRGSGRRKPRSAAYKSAQSKLGLMMKSGIKKAEAHWKAYNSPEAKYERQTKRAIEKARKGKLKYGKLTDDQVNRITERLYMERQARQLSDTEQTFRHRLAKSIGEGVISGIGQGFGRKVSESIARGSILKTDRLRAEQQNELNRENALKSLKIERKKAEQQNKLNREFEREKDRYDNSRAVLRKKAKDAANAEYYRMRIEEGEGIGAINRINNRLPGAQHRRIEYLKNTKDQREYNKDMKERQRESRQSEATMAREIMKSKQDRIWNAYQEKLKGYNEDVKEWRKAGSVGPRPRRPSQPSFDIDQYYIDYDELRRRRNLT